MRAFGVVVLPWVVVGAAVEGGAGPCPTKEVPWPSSDGSVSCEALSVSQGSALAFLKANAPPWDVLNEYTLFGAPGGVDGLEFGVASVAANATLEARMTYA